MSQNLIGLLVVVIPIVITALLGWISPYVVKFLDSKIGHNNAVALENFARIAVTAAEQQVKGGANSDKKALALAALSGFADDHKYSVTEDNLNALIEAAVFQLKQWGTPISLTASSGEGTTVNVVNEAPVTPAAETAAGDAPVAPAATAPAAGEDAAPASEVPDPIKDEAAPSADPVLSHQTATF